MAGDDNFIDVKKVIRDKNPKLLKWSPKFLIKYLQKIVHEDEANIYMAAHKDDNSFVFCDNILEYFNIDLSFKGLDNVPSKGGCILVMNHPLGGMDAMGLVSALQSKRKDFKFIVNDILMNLQNLKGMFVGVNKVGKSAKESLRKVDELFASDQMVCLFPAGLVSRKQKGQIKDLQWKKTFITRAKKYDKNIIPAHITGQLSNFFYRLSNTRKALGIKANIEMLYLVDEMYKQQNSKMKIIFGEPILASSLDKSKSNQEWANFIQEKVYQLAK